MPLLRAFLFLSPLFLLSQTYILDESSNIEIQTVVYGSSLDFSGLPVLFVGHNNYINFSFDHISDYEEDFSYRIVRMNHDRSALSDLSSYEYIDGFQDEEIDEVIESYECVPNYFTYSFQFPSAYTNVKASGNYRIDIFTTYDDEQIIESRKFIVVDNRVNLFADNYFPSINRYQKVNQQLSVFVPTMQLAQFSSTSNIEVRIIPNRWWHHEHVIDRPTYTSYENWEYRTRDPEFFNVIREFNYFDSQRVNQDQIKNGTTQFIVAHKEEDIDHYAQPNNWAGLFTNGVVKKLADRRDPAYIPVNFKLQQEDLDPGTYFVVGEMNNYRLSEKSKLKYNERNHQYELTMRLKQGIYSYQFVGSNDVQESAAPILKPHWARTVEFNCFVYELNDIELDYKITGFFNYNFD